MPYNAVVFDLDGTLVDSKINYEKMGEQIKQLLHNKGMTTHIEDRRKAYMIIRGGAETLLEYGLPHEKLSETLVELDQVMNKIELEALPTMQLKPYAVETVETLKTKGFKLAIATRSHREYADRTLEKYQMTHLFQAVRGRDDSKHPKPDPRHLLETIQLINATPEETLYIGDTTTDLTTAQAANVPFIGYWRDDAWAKRLMDGGCDRIIKDLREIIEIVLD